MSLIAPTDGLNQPVQRWPFFLPLSGRPVVRPLELKVESITPPCQHGKSLAVSAKIKIDLTRAESFPVAALMIRSSALLPGLTLLPGLILWSKERENYLFKNMSETPVFRKS